jgi:LysR family transcriptional regulator, hydrogen peroxide-inducible genes activator
MNLQQLEYIVALDKFKSFSKAAESCFITQATLSTMVKKLEEELDVVIFDRKNNPVITTDDGKKIIQEAHKTLFHSYRLKEISSEIKEKIEGELRIGIIPTIASNLLHRIIPRLLEKYPNLVVHIQEITTENILSQLKTNELDVGILSTPLKKMEFEEEKLYYEKLMVYGKAENNNTKFLNPKDLSFENVWLLEQGNCLTDQVVNLCSLTSKKISSNLHFSPNSFDSLMNIVDNLNGLTLVPELFYADLPMERKKKIIEFNLPYPVREISLIYHRPYAKLRLIQALSKEIKDIIKPLLQTTNLTDTEMLIAKI